MTLRLPEDEVVVKYVENYSRYLDRLLAAPPTEAELEAEQARLYLEDETWERLYGVDGR